MYNLKFFRTRLHYLRAMLPYLTLRKIYNFLKCSVAHIFRLKKSGHVPPIWVIILTYRCNYSCIMCQKSAAGNNPYKQPKSIDFKKIEAQLRMHHKDILLIQLLGGEPLYYSEIIKVLDLLDELKIAYCVTTNGALLTKEICQRLVKRCVWISISLDAADSVLYRLIRRGGDIETIRKNLRYLNQLKISSGRKLPILNANATVFTYNLYDLKNLLIFCKAHNVKSLSVSGGKVYGTPFVGKEHLVRNLKPVAISVLEEAKKVAKELGVIFRVGFRSLYQNDKVGKRERTYDNYRDLYFEITIQPDLNIVAAGDDYLLMGNLNENKLEAIWNKTEEGYKRRRGRTKRIF